MGYICHHAIIVTSSRDDLIESSHAKAEEICAKAPVYVTPITDATVNGYRSFMLAPDGSKEGWEESDHGNRVRDEFISWLRANRPSTWALVQFGDDGGDDRVLAHG